MPVALDLQEPAQNRPKISAPSNPEGMKCRGMRAYLSLVHSRPWAHPQVANVLCSMRQAVAVLVLIVIVSAGCGRNDQGPLTHPLSYYVVSDASGFVSYPTDPLTSFPDSHVPGTVAGSLTIAGAAYNNCVGIGQRTLRANHWIASELRIWVDNASSPGAYLFLCVTEFDSGSDSTKAYAAALGSRRDHLGPLSGYFHSSSISVPGIPNVQANEVRVGRVELDLVAYSTGRFVVTLYGGRSSGGESSAPIKQVALVEYHRLPSS